MSGSAASGCKGQDADLLAEAAAQTTTNPAAKVTPHLSPARRPAGPRHLMTKCQNSLLSFSLSDTPLPKTDRQLRAVPLRKGFHGNIHHMADMRTDRTR